MQNTIIHKCEELIRDIVNDLMHNKTHVPFNIRIKERLKIDSVITWNILCSLMDVLSDTELAKGNFYKYNL